MSWVSRRWGGGKVSRGCAYVKSEFGIEGRMQGKMGFIVNHPCVPQSVFVLVAYFGYLKFQRHYEAHRQFPLLPPILT